MKENKYYIPTIEEINIGDRFYIQGGQERICTEVSAYPHVGGSTIDVPIKGRSFDKFLLEHVRLKYLDQEDIESLGFVLNPNGAHTQTEDSMFNIDIYIKVGYELLHIHNNISSSIVIFGDIDVGHKECMFRGIVKNKAELKKILKQINIK